MRVTRQQCARYLGDELDNFHEDVQRHIPGHHAAGPFGEKRGGDGYESAGRKGQEKEKTSEIG